MAERTTLNISLTPSQHRFIYDRVKKGRYLSASEVVREALRLFEEMEEVKDRRLDKLKADIQLGYDQLARGEVIDGDVAMKNVRKKIKAARTSRK